MKVSLTTMNSTIEAIEINTEASLKPLQESNRELNNKLEHLERYSNIRLIGIEKEDVEDCKEIVLDYFKILGYEDASGELKTVHRTGKKRDDKARHIIACEIVQHTFQEELNASRE